MNRIIDGKATIVSEILNNDDFEKIYLSRSKSRGEDIQNNSDLNCEIKSKIFLNVKIIKIAYKEDIKIYGEEVERISHKRYKSHLTVENIHIKQLKV